MWGGSSTVEQQTFNLLVRDSNSRRPTNFFLDT